MDNHEPAQRQVNATDLAKIAARLEQHRRERLQKDPFESVDWGASLYRWYPKVFAVAVAMVLLSASHVAFSGTVRTVLVLIGLVGIPTALAASAGMMFHASARIVWRTLRGSSPVYDSLVARVAVNASAIADLHSLPTNALELHRRSLVIEHDRLHSRQLLIWGTKISAVTAVLWILKPAIDLSKGLGGITFDISRVMSDPWLAPWGLLFVLCVLLLPRLHVETLKMHAELLAAAIATMPSSVATHVGAAEKGAPTEEPEADDATTTAAEKHAPALLSEAT